MNWIEISGFVTGALCVGLQVKQNIWNWPLGIANNVLYVIVFWQSGLFADCGLQMVYIIISIYGWWSWLRGGEQHSQLKITRVTVRHAGWIAGVTATGVFAIAWLLKTQTNSTVPWADATTTSLSLSAQYMLSRKILENWSVWIAADLIYIALYIYKLLYLTSFLYLVFLVMCIAGHIRWRQEFEQRALGAPSAV